MPSRGTCHKRCRRLAVSIKPDRLKAPKLKGSSSYTRDRHMASRDKQQSKQEEPPMPHGSEL